MKVLNDFNTTVEKALSEIDSKWWTYPGLIICGTHTPHDEEELINEIQKVRENGTPFLGICFGHQLAAIEYARNVLGVADATSEEFGKGEFIVYKLPNLKVGLYANQIYRLDTTYESYWNNYEVRPGFLEIWQKPPNFITCQFHPEYQSSKDNPHPLLVKFIELCKSK